MSIYPLEQLFSIKKKKFEEAVKIAEEKKKAWEKEVKILQEKEKKKEEVKAHRQDKLSQLRASLDAGERTDKIRQMKSYLEVVKKRLEEEEKKVLAQKKEVEKALMALDLAKKEMMDRQKEIEKISLHKKQWQKETEKLIEQQESLFQDELSSSRYAAKKALKEKKEKG